MECTATREQNERKIKHLQNETENQALELHIRESIFNSVFGSVILRANL